MNKETALKPFRVTLNWNPNDSEEGTYCDVVWARDDDAAVLQLATEMADHSASGATTAAGKKVFIKNAVANASPQAAQCIAASVLVDVHYVLAGPQGCLNADAASDYATIKALLSKYGSDVPKEAPHSTGPRG